MLQFRSVGRSFYCFINKKFYSTKSLSRTCLYDFHVQNGGKMVPFAGYEMPVQYKNLSIPESHVHTRKKCSIFDVSHMLQTQIYGKDRIQLIESLVTGDIAGLPVGQGTLTLFTNQHGGIIDDLIVNKIENHLYVVSNAGCKHTDIPILKEAEEKLIKSGKDVKIEFRDDLGLIAVQGPMTVEALQPLVDVDLTKLYFMNSVSCRIGTVANCRITRCGYTGEDGVEISVPSDFTEKVVQALLATKGEIVQLAGLGARDSLRLEAGLCLYGNDMNENITPPEAGLAWLIAKRRRGEKDFPGASVILEQLKDKTKIRKKRIGLVSEGPCPRNGMKILDQEGNSIGEITSGCPSPSLGHNVMMGYVPPKFASVGTQLQVEVRGKIYPSEAKKMPFVKTHYHMPPKQK